MSIFLQSYSTLKKEYLPETFAISSSAEIEVALEEASAAFIPFAKKTFIERAEFLEAIAEAIMNCGDTLLQIAQEETALPLARLTGERGRTCTQLNLYAKLLREGNWCDAVIDTAMPDRQPLPRADLRRILQPIGPVLVFGASNFPFAYSTAGGDTASALAAGCPVIVKAHESHLGTNAMVAEAVKKAAEKTHMPKGVFATLIGTGPVLGQQLAMDERIKAIGFTGSYKAGMALYTTATQKRKTPIPVYAEMSSINPVVLLPQTLAEKTSVIATALAGSISLGVGQFCTSPGLLFAIDDEAAKTFAQELVNGLKVVAPATMLNPTICHTFYKDKASLANSENIQVLFDGDNEEENYKAAPALMQTTAAHFMLSPALQKEVFGPCSLLVLCKDMNEMQAAIASIEGQLTGSIYGNESELKTNEKLVDSLQQTVGRIIFNNVPTGVEVCNAIVHGGPYPATTDARTTSVGPEAIRRFARPICYQDCPDALLPLYLRNHNEAGIVRLVNGEFTKADIVS
ncbi:aldehyde dehydrogenase (NADP(+)) [Sediminibacterium sp. TEGAF015]|uniref:aldehyde dehydrogenase (NADP(+)) n=1 Tax=Sediminibacterium sp. TEGAF015 TaxID=575378 RepID=UPI00220BE05F|nr:aldehyde dehydrogenase (NADP(+)) [Sediminibacterium sp. TEGAF015]BDQ12763.1 2,5-dioxovalerate dehydrogenase [Sediminibacterium sp. TEGAF015]